MRKHYCALYIVWYHIVCPYSEALFWFVSYCIVSNCITLYCIVLDCIGLYWIALYCIFKHLKLHKIFLHEFDCFLRGEHLAIMYSHLLKKNFFNFFSCLCVYLFAYESYVSLQNSAKDNCRGFFYMCWIHYCSRTSVYCLSRQTSTLTSTQMMDLLLS